MALSYASAATTVCETGDWEITNLQLHKLLYIGQLRSLGERSIRDPLVHENFEAWKFGPVISDLYHRVKRFGDQPIRRGFFNVGRNLRLPEHNIIRKVVRDYGDVSPGELVEITHRAGGAWDFYYEPDIPHIVIPNRAIRNEYVEDPI